MRRWIIWRYKRRAARLESLVRVGGLDWAVEVGIARGWVREDLWRRERRIQLRSL